MDWTQGTVLCGWPEYKNNSLRLELGKIRRTNLPPVENAGVRKALPIADIEGLSETTHMIFFPKNIIGAEFNFFGPRASALSDYSIAKAPGAPHFRVEPLLHQDAVRQLDDLEDLRLLAVRVHPSQTVLLQSANANIPDALESLTKQYNAGSVELILRAQRGKTLRQGLLEKARTMLRRSKNPSDDFQKFQVRGRSRTEGTVVGHDLLMDRFISKAEVVKPPKHRSVDSESMYTAINAAYNELKDDLERAASVEIVEET